MEDRSRRLDALATMVDGVDSSGAPGRLFSELPAALRRMLADGKLQPESPSGAVPKDWMRTAKVVSASESVYVEERDAAGTSVDIELP